MKIINKTAEYIENNYKVIFVVLIAVFLFYWFQWRPVHTKSVCAAQALKLNSNPDGKTFNEKGFNATYSLCLHKHGL